MKSKMVLALFVIFTLVLFIDCGNGEAPKQSVEEKTTSEKSEKSFVSSMQEGAQQMQEAMQQMGQAMGNGKKVETVSFRELKALLPEKAGDLKRTNASGEKTAAFGINVSQAEATYESDDGASVDLKISDMGSLSGMVAMAAYSWAMADFERETEDGYERTSIYKDQKSYEKENSDKAEISVLVEGRFIIEINGYNVKMDVLKKTLDEIDIDKLKGWKDFGISEKK